MKEIAEKLKALRLANRMTLKQLASKAGCTGAYLSQLERGRANPSIMILKKVASALQVKVVDFFLEPETEENDVVCKEGERVNIRFKQGDAKIQMLVRNIQNEPLPGLKPGVSGLWHAWHDLRPCQTMPEKASASLRKDAIHPQALKPGVFWHAL